MSVSLGVDKSSKSRKRRESSPKQDLLAPKEVTWPGLWFLQWPSYLQSVPITNYLMTIASFLRTSHGQKQSQLQQKLQWKLGFWDHIGFLFSMEVVEEIKGGGPHGRETGSNVV